MYLFVARRLRFDATSGAEFADGSKLTFCSSSQNYLMMPWRNGAGAETFSAAIPRALVAVLPEVSTNRGRLAVSPHAADVGDLFTTGLADDELRLSAEMIAPRAFADLQSRFHLQSISYYSYTMRALDVTLDGAVVVGQGRNPLYWMVLADRRAIAWKEFVVGHLPPGGKLCSSLFMEGMQDMDDMIASHPTDNCIGRVYGPDGQAQ